MTSRRAQSGFTLIEMLVVVLILAILVVVGLPMLMSQRDKAADGKSIALLSQARTTATHVYLDQSETFGTETQAVRWLNETEPGFNFKEYDAPNNPSAGNDISVDVHPSHKQASLCVKSKTERVFCMRLDQEGLLVTGDSGQAASALSPLERLLGVQEAHAAASSQPGIGWNNSTADGFVSRATGKTEEEARCALRRRLRDMQADPEGCGAATADWTTGDGALPTPEADTPVVICHTVGTIPGYGTTMTVPYAERQAHLDHGDLAGPCLEMPEDPQDPDPPVVEQPNEPPAGDDPDRDSDGVPDSVEPPAEVVDPCNPDPNSPACNGFLSFMYFTDFETTDPELYTARDRAWAATNCGDLYAAQRHRDCTEIQFGGSDEIAGPLHSNDEAQYCGSVEFGRSSADRIEFGSASGLVRASGCSSWSSYVMRGTLVRSAARKGLPQTNTRLGNEAERRGLVLSGKTTLELDGTNVRITDSSGAVQTRAIPANGVIAIASAGSCTAENPSGARYTESAGCANVYVSGTYSRDVTITAANDIIIKGSVTRSGNAVLGLIANNFVRVYHPLRSGACENSSAWSPRDVTVHAAILALNHSFVVDNHKCGSRMGELSVDGAIAQKYRGPVGTGSGSSVNTGYAKDYSFDDRLRTHSPPFFLAPTS